MGVVLTSASQTFGRYQLLEFIGSGGMSDVFVALHTGLRKRVALKLLRPFLRKDAEAVRRFLREGECAARVSHPNVVHVTDVGMEQDIPYLVMELLDGETLEDKLTREGPLALCDAVDLCLTILEGLAATHAAGVLHRDIKPGNILLARTQDGGVVPKLVDFGIATLAERGNITGAIGPIGTPHYMSPEQARGAEIDFRSDLYSLASVLYELLTGEPPYGEGDVETVLGRVSRGRFPRISEKRPALPRELDDLFARATAYEPARRFASIEDMAHALLAFAGPRMRRLWVSRDARMGVPSSLYSPNAWRADALLARPTARFDQDPDATARYEVTPVTRRSRIPLTRPRSSARYFVPVGLAVCAAFVALALRIDATLPPYAASQAEAALPLFHTVERGPGAALPVREETARALAPRTPRVVALFPAQAEATLDGESLGTGFIDVPTFDDDEVHELRVSAPRHIPRVLLFRRHVDAARVELEPIKPVRHGS